MRSVGVKMLDEGSWGVGGLKGFIRLEAQQKLETASTVLKVTGVRTCQRKLCDWIYLHGMGMIGLAAWMHFFNAVNGERPTVRGSVGGLPAAMLSDSETVGVTKFAEGAWDDTRKPRGRGHVIPAGPTEARAKRWVS